jgi:hypothetical protein
MLLNVTVEEKCMKMVLVRGTCNEKTRIAVMLLGLADGHKLPPYVILRRKTILKEKLLVGLVFQCQGKVLMTSDLMMHWTTVVWN